MHLVRPVVLLLALAAACARQRPPEAPAPLEHRADEVPAAPPSPPPSPVEPPVEAIGVDTPPDLLQPPASATRHPSGLISRVLRPGTGTVSPGPDDTVTAHYSLWTEDGKLVDSSVTRNQPFRAKPSHTIPGFSEALQLMVVGEIRRIWVPEDLAYKGVRLPGTLVFDVQLIAIEPSSAGTP